MNLKKFFRRNGNSTRVSSMRPRLTWKVSLVLLVMWLLALLLFDGYIFLFRVQDRLIREQIDTSGEENQIPGINREFLGRARSILNERERITNEIPGNVLSRNPFE